MKMGVTFCLFRVCKGNHMRATPSPLLLARLRLTPSPWLALLLATGLLLNGAFAQGDKTPAGKDDFSPLVKLAPFVVNGQSLAVSIHARTKVDRRYGEKFAEEVVEIAYETLGTSTGRGLVIVGADGEPHPIHFFRKFLEMSRAGQLDPGLAEAAGEVDGMLKKAQEKMRKIDEDPAAMPTGITFDTFVRRPCHCP